MPVHLQRAYEAADRQSCVIVIPDLGTSQPDQWCAPTGKPWIQDLRERSAPNADVYVFTISSELSTTNWQRLQGYSDQLLEELYQFTKDGRNAATPIQYICVGLGGLIFKQTLRSASQAQRSSSLGETYTNLLSCIAGIIFIATPHLTSKREDDWRTIASIPRIRDKNAKKDKFGQEEIRNMSQICQQFDQLYLGRPLLVVYESHETLVPSTFLSKKHMIVGKARSTIGGDHQVQELELECDFSEAHTLSTTSDAFSILVQFVQTSISYAQIRLMVERDRAIAQPHDLEQVTVRTYTEYEDHNLSQHNTANATAGSSSANSDIVMHNTDFEDDRLKIGVACRIYGNRRPCPVFCGRDDVLQQIEDILLPSESGAASDSEGLRTFSICGLGGIGKTELATHFMFKNADRFDNIFWLQSDQTAILQQEFSQLAVKLGLEEESEAKDQISSTSLVKAWLEKPLIKKCHETRPSEWLIIFDNVDDADDLNDFWPQFSRGSILITSRDPLSKSNIYSAPSGIDLTPLKEEDGAKLLNHLTNRGQTQSESSGADAAAVSQRLDGLPVGIIQMAGIINRMDYTFAEFLKRYDEKSFRTMHTNMLRPGGGYAHTIASVWALEQLDKSSGALLDVISLLSPDDIEEDILNFTNKSQTEEIDSIFSILEGFPQDSSTYETARSELTRRSLVHRNREQARLNLHRMTQDAAIGKMSNERFHQIFRLTNALLSARWPFPTLSQSHSTARWLVCERYAAHVLRLHSLYKDYVKPGSLFVPPDSFALLLIDTAGYYLERGGSDRFKSLLDCAQEICEAQDPSLDTRELMSELHYIRGAQATEMNNREVALPSNTAYLETRIDIAKSSPQGKVDPKLAHAYNQAGNSKLDRGHIEEAIELYLTCLKIHESIPGNTQVDRSIPVANLGNAYWLQGRLEEAAKVLDDNIKARESKFGPDDTESCRTGRLLHAFGNVRASQADFTEALRLHQRALNQYRKTLGDNHHRTADLCYKVAEHYVRLGQYTQARVLLEQAQKIYASRPYFRQELARTKFMLSFFLPLLGNEDEAVRLRNEALELYRSIAPQDKREDYELDQRDFDGIVTYASR